ncbi:hypothetical protein HY988_00815 [Candidatus Micrarchaeota archaeon]|nr:hypothetical protein [Candidatus Micrarchaeota archaeon]
MRPILLLFSVLVVFCAVSFADAVIPNAPPFVAPSTAFSVGGQALNSSSQNYSNVNVTVTIGNSSNSSMSVASNLSGSDGTFRVYLTSPSSEGIYNITITSNSSALTVIFPLIVSNISNVSIAFIGSPSFSPGTPFNISINLTNSSGGGVANILPNINAFSASSFANGTDWVFTNLSNGSASNGNINYTVTPTNNSGSYFIVIGHGAGTLFINLISDSQLIVTLKRSGFASNLFSPSENATVSVLLRSNSNGSVFSSQTVAATLTYPDGTASSISSFSETSPGVYEKNITLPSTEGTYKLIAQSTVSSNVLESSFKFSITSLSASLQPTNADEGKFVELSDLGFNGAKPGANMTLFFLLTNLSNNQFLSHSSFPSDNNTVNCSAVTVTSLLRLQNNTDYRSYVGSFNFTNTSYLGSTICALTFAAPNDTGFYKTTAQVTYQGRNYSGVYTFQVQRYLLKVVPLSSGGSGQDSFQMLLKPGSNITLLFQLYNISNEGAEISNAFSMMNATNILHFVSGTNILPGQYGFNNSVSNTTNTVTITLPPNYTDIMLVGVSATTIYGDSLTSNVPIIAKRLVGFMAPAVGGGLANKTGENPPPPGGPGGFGGSGQIRCASGDIVAFNGRVNLVETGSAISGVSFTSNLSKVISELSGRDVSSCLSMNASSTSDSNGSIAANISYSCSLPPGRYVVMFNASYPDGGVVRNEIIPGFFSCSVISANIQATPVGTSSSGGGFFFQVSKSGCILLNTTSVGLTNGSNFTAGTLSVPQVSFMNFFGGSGGQRPDSLSSSASTLNASLNQSGGSLIICPQNFTTSNGSQASSWGSGSGFLAIRPRVCTSGDVACQDFDSGVPVGSSLETYIPFGPDAGNQSNPFQQPQTGNIGSNITLRIASFANLTNITSIRMNKEGPFPPTTVTSYNMSYLRNNTRFFDNRSFMLYELNMTIPTSISKGSNNIMIEVVGASGDRSTIFYHITVANVLAYVPLYGGDLRQGNGGMAIPQFMDMQLLQYGWNMSFINQTLLGGNLSFSDTVCYNNISAFGGQNDYFFIPLKDVTMNQPADTSFFPNVSFMILDSANTGRFDTLLVRNKTTPNSMNNASAFTIVNVTNRSIGANYSLVSIDSCSYFRAVYSGPISSGSLFSSMFNLGEYGVNTNITVPLVFKAGSLSANGSTANITSLYRRTGNSFGIGTLVDPSNYTVVTNVTDSNGLALLTLNLTTSGVYTIFWRINGTTYNDSSSPGGNQFGMSTNPTIVARNFRPYASTLGADNFRQIREVTNDMNVTLSNASTGNVELFNATNLSLFSYNFGNKTSNVTFNSTDKSISINYVSNMNTSTPAFCDGANCTISSVFQFFQIPFQDQLKLAVMQNSSSGNLSFLKFGSYRARTDTTPFANVNNSAQNVSVLVCAESYAFPPLPLSNANITNATAMTFSQNSPPQTTALAMFDPYTNQSISSIATGPSGCALITLSPRGLSGDVWPSSNFGPPTQVYFTINNTGSIEDTNSMDRMINVFVR